ARVTRRGPSAPPASLHRAHAHHRRALARRAADFGARAVGIGRRDAGFAVERALAGERALLRLLAFARERGDARAVFHVTVADRRARAFERAVRASSERHLTVGIGSRDARAVAE